MPISVKTHKELWAKSGNRCMMCRIEVVEEVDRSTNLIIGEECHIVSSKPNGPRSKMDWKDYDSYENLLVLCANDHKRIDEMTDLYTIDKLKEMKKVHENWVRTTLEKDVSAFANDQLKIKSLSLLRNGNDLLQTVTDVHGYEFDHSQLDTPESIRIVGGLLEELKFLGDMLDELTIPKLAELRLYLEGEVTKVNELGYLIFGTKRKVRLYSLGKDMGLFVSSVIVVVKKDNPSIVGNFLIAKLGE